MDALIYASMGFRILETPPHTRLPLVLANCTAERKDQLSVFPDDAQGAVRALDHLADLGHRRVVMLSGRYAPLGPLEDAGNVSGPIRRDAFRTAALRRGVAASNLEMGWEIRDGYHAAMQVLDVEPQERPTGMFVVTDRAAVGAMFAAVRLGLSVPRDLSIVGFDDQEKLADCTVPPLTTIALPHARMGDEAVAMALAATADEPVEVRQRALPCELLVRESTAPPAPEFG